MLIEAAQRLDENPGPLGHVFRRLARKKNRNVAVVAAARKLAVIGRHMFVTGQPYRFAIPQSTQAKLARLRVKATGQRRQGDSPKGTRCAAKLPGGSRTIHSLGEVYQASVYRGPTRCEQSNPRPDVSDRRPFLAHLTVWLTIQPHTRTTRLGCTGYEVTQPSPEGLRARRVAMDTRLGAVVVLCVFAQLAAATTPYQVVLLDYNMDTQTQSLMIVDFESGSRTRMPPDTFKPGEVDVGVDGSILGVDNRFNVGRYDFADKQWDVRRYSNPLLGGPLYDMEVTPDGELVVIGDDTGVRALDLETGEQVLFFALGPTCCGPADMGVSPAGEVVANTWNDGRLYRTERQVIGEQQRDSIERDVGFNSFAYSQDGRLFGVGGLDTWDGLYRIDFDTGQYTLLYENEALRWTNWLEVDPDGRFLALAKWQTKPDELMRIDIDSGTIETRGLDTYYANSPSMRIIPDPRLQPGDAEQDYDFDQLDLVRVQVAGKYLTGESATWGEGDWNGAPGGQQGSPPVGDGLFDQSDIIASLATDIYLTGPYAASTDDSARTLP